MIKKMLLQGGELHSATDEVLVGAIPQMLSGIGLAGIIYLIHIELLKMTL